MTVRIGSGLEICNLKSLSRNPNLRNVFNIKKMLNFQSNLKEIDMLLERYFCPIFRFSSEKGSKRKEFSPFGNKIFPF